MKNNIFMIIGLSSIFLFLSYQIYINEYDNKKQEEQNKIINTMNKKDDYKYIGYIEIPKINVRRVIKDGTDDEIIDSGYVGLLKGTTLTSGNTVLAGHNRPKIFEDLNKLELNDLIIIKTINRKYIYHVKDKTIIKNDNFKYFKNTEDKILTLLTCTEKRGERLIIIAK